MGQQEESVSIGMWMFLVQEIMFFGGLFTAISYSAQSIRWRLRPAVITSTHFWGGLNTLVLIVSSLTMALDRLLRAKEQPEHAGDIDHPDDVLWCGLFGR